MATLRIVLNVIILILELAMVAGVAWLGYRYPLIFAAVTLVVGFVLGIILENARLAFEVPFYFGKAATRLVWLRITVASGEAMLKALLAGVVALLTFAGTDKDRVLIVAIIFAIVTFAGSSLLRRLSLSLDAVVSRWGYFRLAAPLGLLFSAATSFLPPLSFADIGRTIALDLPAKPGIDQASELLFLLKQKFDEMVVTLLTGFADPWVAKLIGTLASVNMLTGFILAIYAVVIADIVSRLEWLTSGRTVETPPAG